LFRKYSIVYLFIAHHASLAVKIVSKKIYAVFVLVKFHVLDHAASKNVTTLKGN